MIFIPVYKGRERLAKCIVYFGCLYFCLFYLNELFDKRYATYFELKRSPAKYPKISICISLMATDHECTELTRGQVEDNDTYFEIKNGCKNYMELVTFYNDLSISKSPRDVLRKANELELNRAFVMIGNFTFVEYYLNSNSLCLKYEFTNLTKFYILNVYR